MACVCSLGKGLRSGLELMAREGHPATALLHEK